MGQRRGAYLPGACIGGAIQYGRGVRSLYRDFASILVSGASETTNSRLLSGMGMQSVSTFGSRRHTQIAVALRGQA